MTKLPDTPIVVVDDDPGMRLLIGVLASAHGYDVVAASSAEDAIRRLQAEPDVAAVITDFAMPGRSGLELLRWVKGHRPSCPVVLMSASFPPGVEAEARAAGAAAVVKKQVVVDRLVSVLDSARQPAAA